MYHLDTLTFKIRENMEWSQVLAIALSNLGMFLWATRQARTDFHQSLRMIENLQKENKEMAVKMARMEEKQKEKS